MPSINDVISNKSVAPDTEQNTLQNDTAVTQDEQQAYERVVLAGVKVISDPSTNPQIMKMLGDESAGGPAQRLATTTSTIFSQLDEKSRGTIPEAVILNSAGEILENVAEFANESGVMSVDQNMLTKAGQFLLIEMANIYDFDPNEVEELTLGMDEKEVESIVKEQDAIARSDNEVAANLPTTPLPQQAIPQQLPGIINQTIGG